MLSTVWAARRLDAGARTIAKRLRDLVDAGEIELVQAGQRLRRAARYRYRQGPKA
jgi:hypothetical protein